jgi:maleylacetoacetate isomerase
MTGTVLYDYWRSSAAYRVRIALNLLALPYRSVPVDLTAGEQRGAANLRRNPQGLVPTLDIDGLRLTQSLAILEYLDETRAAGWLPQAPDQRAAVRATAQAIAIDIHPVCNLRVARHAEALGGTMEGWMRHFILLGLEGVEALLQRTAGHRFCHGDGVSLTDICLVPQVYNAHRWGVDLARFPRLAQVSAALGELAAVRAAHPERARPAG